jgi:thioredoxin 1
MKKIMYLFGFLVLLLSIQCAKSQNYKSVDAATFKTKLDSLPNEILLDVRTPEEYLAGHLHNATNIAWGSEFFKTNLSYIDKSKTIMVYCQAGGRSKKAANMLHEMGFKNIVELDGGYNQWKNTYPNETTK